MNTPVMGQWFLGPHYFHCSLSQMGTWRRRSLPLPYGKTEFLTGQICPDISCTLSECFSRENFKSQIHYAAATSLLVFGIEGYTRFRFAASGGECTIRAGDVWLMNVRDDHLHRCTPAGVHARMLVLKYTTARLNRACKSSDEISLLISQEQMIRLGRQEPADEWTEALIRNPMVSATDRLLAESQALELIARWLTPVSVEQKVQEAEEPLLQKVIDLLISDLAQPPSLEVLARKVGMSHTRLNRLFKASYGKTVFDWLRGYRMERARGYLKDQQRSITDIAFQCGFSSASHFAQAFKKQFGCSPTEYRETEMG